jgi:PadR family transcriptional regulator PadR
MTEKVINADNIKVQMRKGILEYCILIMLSKNDAYASSIITALKDAQMIVADGTLYPLLKRQKNQGLLCYRWEESAQEPPKKYYTITDKGRRALNEMDTVWNELVDTIACIKKA